VIASVKTVHRDSNDGRVFLIAVRASNVTLKIGLDGTVRLAPLVGGTKTKVV
jgi:hypothetical protein